MDLVTETFHFPGDIKSVFIFSFFFEGPGTTEGMGFRICTPLYTVIDASLKKQSVI